MPQLAALPAELFTQIIKEVEEPWGMDKAEKIREKLMNTRGNINEVINDDMEEVRINVAVVVSLYILIPFSPRFLVSFLSLFTVEANCV